MLVETTLQSQLNAIAERRASAQVGSASTLTRQECSPAKTHSDGKDAGCEADDGVPAPTCTAR